MGKTRLRYPTTASYKIGYSRSGFASINNVYNFINRTDGGLGASGFWNIVNPQNNPTPPAPPVPGLYCQGCGDQSQVDLHDCSACVLSCMDFRLRDNINCNLVQLGYRNQYDEFILAGASLGYNGVETAYPDWVNTANDTITLARDLHHISQLIIIDHMNCGAYHIAYPDLVMGGAEEYDKHVYNLNIAAESLMSRFGPSGTILQIPDLTITKYIISINGSCLVNIDEYVGPYPFAV